MPIRACWHPPAPGGPSRSAARRGSPEDRDAPIAERSGIRVPTDPAARPPRRLHRESGLLRGGRSTQVPHRLARSRALSPGSTSMRGWRRGPGDEALATSPDTPLEGPIAGDRGIPSLEGARSVQSRVSRLLAVSFMSVLGAGLLTWYYARALSHPGQVRRSAQTAVRAKAQGEMTLPPLGPIAMPRLQKDPASSPPVPAPDPGA